MKYLLDTNICIYIINKKPLKVFDHFSGLVTGEIGVSALTVAELEFGAAKSQARARNEEALARFLSPLEVVPFGEGAARHYGVMRAALERKGTPIGAVDMLIAAQALSVGATLITNDLGEFRRVPGLRCKNWV